MHDLGCAGSDSGVRKSKRVSNLVVGASDFLGVEQLDSFVKRVFKIAHGGGHGLGCG